MNRRNLLKTFLAAPAIIRSGVLMPVVPLAAPAVTLVGLDLAQEPSKTILFRADRVWVQDHQGRRVYDTGEPDLEALARKNFGEYFARVRMETFERAMRGEFNQPNWRMDGL